ncbi:DUF3616 domain-containing protein [Hoeflea sp.]|uniref:DUF3616 domain-containing protein n=1 Tax=Hoeflea sp. TaxID=1940281 RepID=UPI003B0243C0
MTNLIKFLLVSIALSATAPCLAADPVVLDASGEPLFAEYDEDAKAGENVSGAVCFENGSCILVSDEMIAVQRIDLDLGGSSPDYRAGRTYGALFSEFCEDIAKKKDCKEVDLEAIARDGSNVLVSGSMGNASKSGNREKKRWFLAQFALDEQGKPKTGSLKVKSDRGLLKRLFSGHAAIEPYVGKPLQCAGLNVEGMAYLGGDLFFGLRSPTDRDKGAAFIVQSPKSIMDASSKSDVEGTRLHRLSFKDEQGKPLSNTGIRALEPINGKLLIATGDAGVSAPSEKRKQKILDRCANVPNGAALANVTGPEPEVPRIWIWDPNAGDDPRLLARLDGPYATEKLEGIAVLPTASSDKSVDLLLTIDGQNAVPALALLRNVLIVD